MTDSKYHARKAEYDGHTFDSAMEMERYIYLRAREENGEISDLRTQVQYELIPKTKGERAITYKVDFQYTLDGRTVVEDVKGYATRDYILRRKIFKWRYPEIKFLEVKNIGRKKYIIWEEK